MSSDFARFLLDLDAERDRFGWNHADRLATFVTQTAGTEPSVHALLIVDEPTRGIDVGTKAEVHRLLSELAGQGLAILMISSELPEVLGMADRVLVVCEGRITAGIARDEATPENVMAAATRSSEKAAS